MAKDNNQNDSGTLSFSESLLDFIRKAHERFLATDDSGEVFKFLLESLVSLTDSEYGFLDEVLRDDNGDLYKLSLALSDISWDDDSRKIYNDLVARNLEFRNLSNLSGAPAVLGKLVIANDAPHDSRSGGLPAGHPSIQAYMGLPLYFGGELVGVAGIANRPGGYDEDMAKALEPFLSTCASMIHATRQREKVRGYLKEIEDSNQTMGAILGASPESSFLIDTNGIVLNGNDMFAKRLDHSIEDLLGKNVFDYLPQEIGESRKQKVNEALQSGRMVQFDDVKNDRIFSHHIFPIRDQSGTIDRVAIFGADITEKRRAEEAIRQSEIRLKESNQVLSGILDNTDVLTVLLDRKFNFIWVNKAYAKSCRFEPSYFPGKNLFDLYPHQENEAIFQSVVDNGEPFFITAKPFEFPDQPDRGVTYWDWSLIPIKNHRNEVTHLVFTLREVTERIHTEAALKESLLRETEAVKAANVGFWDWDLKTDRVHYSVEWKRQIGYEDHEINDDFEEWRSRVHPEDLEETVATVQEDIRTLSRDFEIRFRFLHKDGSYRWILAQGSVFGDESGQPVRMLGSHTDITRLVTAEDEARKHRRELELTVNATTDGLWKWNFLTNEMEFSPRYYTMLGYEPNEFPADFDNWKALIHPHDLDHALSVAAEFLETKQDSYENEFRLRTKSGKYRWIKATARVVERTRDGEAVRMIGNHQDVTEHKLMERALKKSEHEKSIILDSTTEMFAIYDLDLRVIWANRAAGESVGKNMEDLVGKCCYEIWNQKREPCEGCPVLKAKETKEPQETMRKTPDGRIWRLRGYPILDDDGNIVNLVVFGYDITEKKLIEDRNSALAEMVDSAPNTATVHDSEGRFVYANRKTFELHGYTPEEFFAINLHELDVPESAEKIEAHTREIIELGESTFEVGHFRKDGSVLRLEVSVKPIVWEGKKGFLSIGRDITERKQAEEAMIASEALFREMFKANEAVMLLIDPNTGQIVEANQAAARYYGYPLENLVQMKIQQINVLPSAEVSELMGRAFNKQVNIFEFPHLLANGQIRDVEAYSTPLKIQNQTRLFSIINDITERKQTEERLRKSEASYRALTETIPDLLFKIDKDLRFVFIHAGRTEKLLIPKEEALNKNAYDLLPPELAEMTERNVKASLSTGEIFEYEYSLPVDGGIHYYEARMLRCSPDEVLVLVRNVTERKQAENQFLELNARKRAMLDTTLQSIVLFSSAGEIVMLNKTAEFWIKQVYGHDAKEGDSAFVFPHPEDIESFRLNFRKALNGKKTAGEWRTRDQSGKVFWFALDYLPIWENNVVSGICFCAMNITELKLLEEEIKNRQTEAEEQSRLLERKNIALSELIDHARVERELFERRISNNIEQIVLPIVSSMKLASGERREEYAQLLENSLRDLLSEKGSRLARPELGLTPREIQICEMIKQGLSSKEIAKLLGIGLRSIDSHRYNIRKRLGLSDRSFKLITYLKSL